MADQRQDPIVVAQDRLRRAKALQAAKVKASDQLTYELGALVTHISDLQDIIDSFKVEA